MYVFAQTKNTFGELADFLGQGILPIYLVDSSTRKYVYNCVKR
jgi:hypothetical protein